MQQNGHIAKLCEPPASARNYLYNLFFVQNGQMGRREEAHHVTMLQCYMLHVTIPPTPSTSINSPQAPCKQLLLSILQPKSHARRKPARRLSSARVFTFVNKKPSSPTLFSAQKTGESALDSHKNAYFAGSETASGEGKNRGAAVAMAHRSVVFRCICCSCRFLPNSIKHY